MPSGIKMNTKSLKKFIKDETNNEYILLSEYINCNTKILLKHKICNNEFSIKPKYFTRKNGSRCPYCSGKILKSNDEFLQEVKNIVGDEYTFLEKYVNTNTKLKVRHNKCNNIYYVTPNNFINQKRRCSICNKRHKLTNDDFINEIKKIYGDRYTPLENYINTDTKINIRCNICNNIWKVSPYNLKMKKCGCPTCSGNKKKTNNEFLQEVKNIVGDEYIFLEKYVNSDFKLKVKHNKCNNIYYVTPDNFINQNKRCPFCKRSKGEEKIAKWLNEHNFLFEIQYKFKDCKYKKPLKFDFKLDDTSGKIILIEFDGEQHYKKCWYDSYEDFNERKKRDQIKNDYCNSHDNIDLYRIPYWNYDKIDIILNEIITKYD